MKPKSTAKMKQFILCLALLYPILSSCQGITIKGSVINEEGTPLAGASITIKQSGKSAVADSKGNFTITNTRLNDTLIVSAIGYQTATEPNNERGIISITLRRKITQLDETIIMGYGSTTKRFNTGSISKLSAAEIKAQPVTNPLAVLYGRIPGLEIVQNSGMPGAGFKLLVRGQASLTQGTEPLYVVDGIPFLNGNTQLNQTTNAANGGLSPLTAINPADIESIELLKDADATAIYGSRGANGVLLITTRKASSGKLTVSASYKTGFSQATRTMNMLSTTQYLQMRREAFANDGITPTTANAPDLLLWDTTRCTDFKKLFTGGRAPFSEAQLSLGAGTASTRFLLSMGYQQEATVLSTSLNGKRYSSTLSLSHFTPDKKFSLSSSMGFNLYNSNLLRTDLAAYINLPPHFRLYDSTGAINFKEGSTYYSSLGLTNPLALMQRTYKGSFVTLISSLTLTYKITSQLSARWSNGFQQLHADEQYLFPRSSLDPSSSLNPSAEFSQSKLTTLLSEPQLEYSNSFGSFKINLLAGASFQQTENRAGKVLADNYTGDLLLSTPAAAASWRVRDDYSMYRYAALFGRINIRYKETWILNLSSRRDGSSRFGPSSRFATFGAAGAAWIFTNRQWVRKKLPFISFGKLRASAGITGNDQVGNYQYLSTWSVSSLTYQSTPALQPTRLFNPDYGWEKNTKTEVAAELGFFNDRLYIVSSVYRNISSNQLVNYSLPVQTGFTTVLQNFNATIENKGFELSVTSKNIAQQAFTWSTSFIFSVNRNLLLSFPDIVKTPYRSIFRVGNPLSTVALYQYLGIDAATGIYRFRDADSNGTMNTTDRVSLRNTAPRFTGGISNTITYKNMELLFLFEFRKQTGKNYLATQGAFIPGYDYYNQPLLVLNRWQKPGDQSLVQRFTASTASPAFTPAQSWLANSDAVYSNASFIRLRNISLTFRLPQKYRTRWKLADAAFFLQAQNMLTITGYKGADPENQSLYTMPPMRTMVTGLRIQL